MIVSRADSRNTVCDSNGARTHTKQWFKFHRPHGHDKVFDARTNQSAGNEEASPSRISLLKR